MKLTGLICLAAASLAWSLTFVQIGDSQGDAASPERKLMFAQTIDSISHYNPELLLSTGDLCDEYSSTDSLSLAAWKDILTANPVTGALLSAGKVRVTLGNHDMTSTTRDGSDPVIIPSYADPDILEGGTQGYGFSAGNCFFVSLKYENEEWRNIPFLDSILSTPAAKAADWRIVIGHRPVFNCQVDHFVNGVESPYGYTGNTYMTDIRNVFDTLNVNLFMNGHAHCYERSNLIYNGTVVDSSKANIDGTKAGTIYITSGLCGGWPYATWTGAKYWWTNTYWNTYPHGIPQFQLVQTSATELKLVAKNVNNGSTIDSFVVSRPAVSVKPSIAPSPKANLAFSLAIGAGNTVDITTRILSSSRVSFEVYDIAGHCLRKINQEQNSSGLYHLNMNGLSKGIHLIGCFVNGRRVSILQAASCR